MKKKARKINTQMVLFKESKKKPKKEITPEQKEYYRRKNLGKLIDFLEKLENNGVESPLF